MSVIMLPIFLHAVVKECLMRLKLIEGSPKIVVLLSIIISVLLLVPILLIMICLAIYRSIIDFYLQKIYKNNYRGLMEGIDSICCNQENCVPSLWTFVEFNGGLKELKQAVISQLERAMSTKHQKLFYSRGEFMGYHYYYAEDVPAETYITLMVTNGGLIDKERISKMFMPYNKSPMPCNDKKLLHVVICPQPVHLDEYPHANIYCVIYRMHHCFGDAKSGMLFFREILADDRTVILESPLNGKKNKSKMSIANIFKSNISIKELPFTVSDRNALRGYKLTENKFVVWFSDTTSLYIDKVKKVRKSINGVTFLDVMNTCLTSSLSDYYKKMALPIPNTIIGGVTFATDISSNFEFVNRFSVAALRLPVGIPFGEGNILMERLKFLNQEYEIVRRSIDVNFNYFCVQNITNLVPSKIMRWASKFIEMTIGISSFPGCGGFTFYDGNEVKDFLMVLPNTPGTALHISIYSFKGQLRIVFTADDSVVPTYEDGKEIVQGILDYLDKLTALCSSENGFSL